MGDPPVDIVDRHAQPRIERCDACNQVAYVVATMRTGLQVFLCGHHATAWWDELERQAIRIDDQRWRLYLEER